MRVIDQNKLANLFVFIIREIYLKALALFSDGETLSGKRYGTRHV